MRRDAGVVGTADGSGCSYARSFDEARDRGRYDFRGSLSRFPGAHVEDFEQASAALVPRGPADGEFITGDLRHALSRVEKPLQRERYHPSAGWMS